MGDLPKQNDGLIVMGDLQKKNDGLIVMGDLPKWKKFKESWRDDKIGLKGTRGLKDALEKR
jgi:hypothetical protein